MENEKLRTLIKGEYITQIEKTDAGFTLRTPARAFGNNPHKERNIRVNVGESEEGEAYSLVSVDGVFSEDFPTYAVKSIVGLILYFVAPGIQATGYESVTPENEQEEVMDWLAGKLIEEGISDELFTEAELKGVEEGLFMLVDIFFDSDSEEDEVLE
jgi:hypothetical protein